MHHEVNFAGSEIRKLYFFFSSKGVFPKIWDHPAHTHHRLYSHNTFFLQMSQLYFYCVQNELYDVYVYIVMRWISRSNVDSKLEILSKLMTCLTLLK